MAHPVTIQEESRLVEAGFLGFREPGILPEIFAGDLLPPEGYIVHSSPAFPPERSEIYFSAYRRDAQPRLDVIMFTRREGKEWAVPKVAPFSGEYTDNWPWFSPDGKRLYFSSRRPSAGSDTPSETDGLWYVARTLHGWSVPKQIRSPSDFGRNDGTIYVAAHLPGGFGSLDIYRLEWNGDTYRMPENLGPSVNTKYEEYGPCVSPCESYILFVRYQDAEIGAKVGLHLSFRQQVGAWSPAINISERLDSLRSVRFPGLSPDGRWLFFVPAGGENVHWVSSKILDGVGPGQVQ
jgi:Tol biopolymer transport system component